MSGFALGCCGCVFLVSLLKVPGTPIEGIK